MSKFYRYINEESEISKFLDNIGKKCKPFLKDFTDDIPSKFLLSGRKKPGKLFKGKVRKDREPRDTPKKYHEYADKLFYEKFGIKARSSTLFCASHPGMVKIYGNPFIIFPIGKYSLIWSSKIEDFYSDVLEDLEYLEEDGVDVNWKSEIEKAVKTYKLVKFNEIHTTRHEIIVYCDEYYAVDYYLFLPDVVKWMEDNYGVRFDAVVHDEIYRMRKK